jgi:hypothetical protein
MEREARIRQIRQQSEILSGGGCCRQPAGHPIANWSWNNGDRGYPSADGYVTTLDAAKLLNAVSRAGRAGREIEGWVALSLN